MNPRWLILIIPASAFLGVAIMCWVGARATDDFHAAIARRDEMIGELCVLVSSLGDTQMSYKDGIVRSEGCPGIFLYKNIDL